HRDSLAHEEHTAGRARPKRAKNSWGKMKCFSRYLPYIFRPPSIILSSTCHAEALGELLLHDDEIQNPYERNTKGITSPGLASPGPHPGARPGVGACRRVPGGGTRPGTARRNEHKGPVQCALGSSHVQGPRRPKPWSKNLAFGTWNVTSLGGRSLSCGGGELLASNGDIVKRWKEYFEDLLNPTDTPSVEEPEAEDSEVDSFITQAEATEVVQQLLSGEAPGVDEIRPEYLKSLDVVGLSWLTRLCNIAWRRGTLDRLYALHMVLEGLWEFAQPVHMCFVDLEKAFDRVPRGILWEVLWEYGVCGPLLRAVWSLYDQSRSLVRIASCKSELFPVHVGLRQGCPLSPLLFIVFMDRISRCSQGLEGVQFGDHRISSLLFADDILLAPSSQDLQCALGCFAAECEAAGMRISTSKSEAMVLDRKKVACTLQARSTG
ncbi:hypothetical protein QTP70_021095, partial [Hemibagrus guttatus]